MTGTRVLIATDDRPTADALKEAFGHEGLEVSSVGEGLQAIDALR